MDMDSHDANWNHDLNHLVFTFCAVCFLLQFQFSSAQTLDYTRDRTQNIILDIVVLLTYAVAIIFIVDTEADSQKLSIVLINPYFEYYFLHKTQHLSYFVSSTTTDILGMTRLPRGWEPCAFSPIFS